MAVSLLVRSGTVDRCRFRGSSGDAPYEAVLSCLHALEGRLGMSFEKGTLYPWTGWAGLPDIGISETMIVEMAATPEETFTSVLAGSVRTAIRKARKVGLVVKIVEDDDELDLACRLIGETQHNVGASYTTPARLIRKIHNSNDLPGELIITTLNGRPISAGVLLLNTHHSFHWLHGWDRALAALCGNQLLIWTMMTRCLNRGCRKLNLGFCHTAEQKNAKQRWGGVIVPVPTLRSVNRNDRDT